MPVSDLIVTQAKSALCEEFYGCEFLHDHQQVLCGEVVVKGGSDCEILMRFAGEGNKFKKDLAGDIVGGVTTRSLREVHRVEF